MTMQGKAHFVIEAPSRVATRELVDLAIASASIEPHELRHVSLDPPGSNPQNLWITFLADDPSGVAGTIAELLAEEGFIAHLIGCDESLLEQYTAKGPGIAFDVTTGVLTIDVGADGFVGLDAMLDSESPVGIRIASGDPRREETMHAVRQIVVARTQRA